jgi:hypothetical protein
LFDLGKIPLLGQQESERIERAHEADLHPLCISLRNPWVDGRPVSDITTQFLDWCCTELEQQGKRAWLLIWDNASWHYSKKVRTWIREHNQKVQQEGKGVRILPFFLPTKSPWLNPIEPKWVHGKRNVVERDGLLSARQLAERICAYYGCSYEPHLCLPHSEKVSGACSQCS